MSPSRQLYYMTFTRDELAELGSLKVMPGLLGRLGERFRKRAEYVDFTKAKRINVSVGTRRATGQQRSRDRLTAAELDEDWRYDV